MDSDRIFHPTPKENHGEFFFFFSPLIYVAKKTKTILSRLMFIFVITILHVNKNMKLNNVDLTLKRLGDRFCNML